MIYRTQVNTPLGPVVLAAANQGLSGLYFADQSDCANAQNHNYQRTRVNNPAHGEHGGKALRLFKVRSTRQNKAGQASLHFPAWQPASRSWPDLKQTPTFIPEAVLNHFRQANDELNAYFHGKLNRFTVPLFTQGTPFQMRIWNALALLPMNELISYSQLGEWAGAGRAASRAVGAAVGRNPVSILIPCHRVVAASFRLTGYGGGLERKLILLQHEGFHVS